MSNTKLISDKWEALSLPQILAVAALEKYGVDAVEVQGDTVIFNITMEQFDEMLKELEE